MKRILIILFAALPGVLAAQKTEIEDAIRQNRRNEAGYYIAYINNLSEKRLIKWFAINRDEYTLKNYDKKYVKEFGYTQTKVSAIYFTSAKMDAFRNASTLSERIVVRSKYNDYRITDLDDTEIASRFWGGELTTPDSRVLFLRTFPEYAKNTTIKETGLVDRRLSEEQIQDYLAVYNDREAVDAYRAEQLKMLDFKIKFRLKDPTYHINDLSDNEVADRFWRKDLNTTTERRHFLAVFPEYKDNLVLRTTGLTPKGLPAGYLIDYAEIFNDNGAVVEYIKKTIKNGDDIDLLWFRTLYMDFKEKVDMIECVDAMINYDEDEDAVVVGKYITYTFSTYFSKSSLESYYASAASYKQLMNEIRACRPMVSKRRRIGNELFTDFVLYQFSANGYSEETKKELIANFADQKVDIEYIYLNNK